MTASFNLRVEYGPLPKRFMADEQLARQAGLHAINMAGPFVARELALRTPSGATGKARQSVIYEPPAIVGFGVITGFVGYGVPASLYIGYVNDGTRPHWPPITPLTYWAARVLGDAGAGYAIAAHIAKYGTRAQKFVERTKREIKPRTVHIMREAFVEFFDRVR